MKISTLRNKYSGERAFLLGNGPSLDDTPLSDLVDEYTFATNKISKIYSDTDWRANFYFNTRSSLTDVDLKFAREAIENAQVSFIANENRNLFEKSDGVYFVNRIQVHDEEYECLNNPTVPENKTHLWSDDISECLYWYNTSFYPMYQVAHYMGFNKIYLLGCDLGMDSTKHMIFRDATDPYLFHKKFKETNKLKRYVKFVFESDKKFKSLINGIYLKSRQILSSELPNFHPGNDVHFGEQYLDTPKIRRGTDDKQRRAHRLAKDKLEERNICVKNATIGGELEVFPRINIEDIL